jgi:hypothetical protein
MSDETWGAICDSLGLHPTLEVLDLSAICNNPTSRTASAVIRSRIQALLNMLKGNMSIHAIHLSPRYSQHELFRGSDIPYLETNRLRACLLPFKEYARLATVPRCWEELFCQLVLMQIASGCWAYEFDVGVIMQACICHDRVT